VEKNPRSLRSHWSFPAHRVFRHSGTDVIPIRTSESQGEKDLQKQYLIFNKKIKFPYGKQKADLYRISIIVSPI
jgi:hypothetical protein